MGLHDGLGLYGEGLQNLPTTKAFTDLEAVSKSSAVTSHLKLPAVVQWVVLKWTTWGEERVICKNMRFLLTFYRGHVSDLNRLLDYIANRRLDLVA